MGYHLSRLPGAFTPDFSPCLLPTISDNLAPYNIVTISSTLLGYKKRFARWVP